MDGNAQRFSIENLLRQTGGSAADAANTQDSPFTEDIFEDKDDDDDDDEDDDEVDVDQVVEQSGDSMGLIRPTPLKTLSVGDGMDLGLGLASSSPQQLLYPALAASPSPAQQLLYSQWLASRSTNALFGLQGILKKQ